MNTASSLIQKFLTDSACAHKASDIKQFLPDSACAHKASDILSRSPGTSQVRSMDDHPSLLSP